MMPPVVNLIDLELERQLALVEARKFQWTARDLALLDPALALAILVEEVGEVARVVNESRIIDAAFIARIREELVQVAAVTVSWLEGLEG